MTALVPLVQLRLLRAAAASRSWSRRASSEGRELLVNRFSRICILHILLVKFGSGEPMSQGPSCQAWLMQRLWPTLASSSRMLEASGRSEACHRVQKAGYEDPACVPAVLRKVRIREAAYSA